MNKRKIKPDINQRFIKARQETITGSPCKEILRFHFAVMEVEAWILGMNQFLQQIDEHLTPALILQQLQLEIASDPEITHYHPAQVLDDIYGLVGKKYGKHEGDICSITSALCKEDYQGLMISGKCNSFKKFVEEII